VNTRRADSDVLLTEETVGSCAPIRIRQTEGTYHLTPASRITLLTIGKQQGLLSGIGIDWGCGTGCLAIAAARVQSVQRVIGLDSSRPDVEAARENAALNDVAHRVTIFHSDSFRPFADSDRHIMAELEGAVDFVVANPSASHGDDGFSSRRRVIAEAKDFLKDHGLVCLQISIQYSAARIDSLIRDNPGYSHEGVLRSTHWVSFDLERNDLRRLLDDYVAEERTGGLRYEFGDPRDGGASVIDARTALALYCESGTSPLTQWQVHAFRYQRFGP
jgi:methylase of polypeptide subunit release factors